MCLQIATSTRAIRLAINGFDTLVTYPQTCHIFIFSFTSHSDFDICKYGLSKIAPFNVALLGTVPLF